MKKNFLAVLFALALCSPTFAQWKPAGDKIKTPWGEQLNPKNVLPEYPRPIMERQDWKNLNGSWNYAITKKVRGSIQNVAWTKCRTKYVKPLVHR